MSDEDFNQRQIRECETLGGLMGRLVSGFRKTESNFAGYVVFTSNSWSKSYIEGNFRIEHQISDGTLSFIIRRSDGSYASEHDCNLKSLNIVPNEIANDRGFLTRSRLSVDVTGSDMRIDFYISADKSKLRLSSESSIPV